VFLEFVVFDFLSSTLAKRLARKSISVNYVFYGHRTLTLSIYRNILWFIHQLSVSAWKV